MRSIYEAQPDTWGISGQRFLVLYLIWVAVALVVALVWRLRAGRPDGAPLTPPDPQHIAYLNGGPKLALYAALAGLRSTGALEAGPGGVLTAVSGTTPPAGELEWAVHTAASRGLRQRDLATDPGVAAVLERTRDALERDGLLLAPARRRQLRLAAIPLFAIATLGIARIVAGVANGKPIGYLAALVLVVVVVALVLLRATRVSRQGRTLLGSLRTDNDHLAPRQSPAWSMYGPAGAALGVGLFGAAAFWAADPAFAQQADIDRRTPTIYGGGSNTTDSGSSSGGSCSSSSGGDSGVVAAVVVAGAAADEPRSRARRFLRRRHRLAPRDRGLRGAAAGAALHRGDRGVAATPRPGWAAAGPARATGARCGGGTARNQALPRQRGTG